MHSVGSGDPVFIGEDLSAGHDSTIPVHHRASIVGRKQECVVLAEHVRRMLADKAPACLVEQAISSLQVLDEDGVGGALNDALQLLALFMQHRFCQFSLCNVFRCSDVADSLTGFIYERARSCMDPTDRSVRSPETELQREFFAGFRCLIGAGLLQGWHGSTRHPACLRV